MKTLLQKTLAGAGVLSVSAMSFAGVATNVFAANTAPTVVYTDVDSSNTFSATDTLAVTVPANTAAVDGGTVDIYVRDHAGVAVDVTNFGAVAGINAAGAAAGHLVATITTAAAAQTFTFTAVGTLAADDVFSVNVLGAGSNSAASAVFATGNKNKVQVTASVAPVLNFGLSANTMALGQLNAAGYTAAGVDATLTTNANGGAAVSVASTGLYSSANNKEIGTVGHAGATPTTGNAASLYVYGVGANSAAAQALITGNTPTGDMAAALSNVVSLPGAGTTTQGIAVGAKTVATTEAGNYADTLTFTVTGTF